MANRRLHVPKAVTAQLLAAVPAGNNDNVIEQTFAFQGSRYDKPGARFAIVILHRPVITDERPGIVRCLGEFLFLTKRLYESIRFVYRRAGAARNGVLRAAV